MSDQEYGTRQVHRAMWEQRARDNFRDHRLAVEGEGRYYCGRPNTRLYHFRVIFAPCCVFLYGDIGDICLMCYSEQDSLNWLRTSPNLDYVLGRATKPEREFMPGDAELCLREWEQQDCRHKAHVPQIRSLWAVNRTDHRLTPAQAWEWAVYEITKDFEVPTCEDWDGQMLYQYHALMKFCELLTEGESHSQR